MEPVCNECAQAAECREPVIMKARILRVNCCDLLVCDLCGCQEVLVHTPEACCFCAGECVCIEYSGAMTKSIPPQINADCIKRLNGNGCGCCCCWIKARTGGR